MKTEPRELNWNDRNYPLLLAILETWFDSTRHIEVCALCLNPRGLRDHSLGTNITIARACCFWSFCSLTSCLFTFLFHYILCPDNRYNGRASVVTTDHRSRTLSDGGLLCCCRLQCIGDIFFNLWNLQTSPWTLLLEYASSDIGYPPQRHFQHNLYLHLNSCYSFRHWLSAGVLSYECFSIDCSLLSVTLCYLKSSKASLDPIWNSRHLLCYNCYHDNIYILPSRGSLTL